MKETTAPLLRIRIELAEEPLFCEWALLDGTQTSMTGAGLLSELPAYKSHVEVVLPASAVLLTHRHLPVAARRQSNSLLAYAVEDVTAGDPLGAQVSWLGADTDGRNTLAVTDKKAMLHWRTALAAAGIRHFELCCETLLLPWYEGSWSLAWNGVEGFVRTGRTAGGATDCGDYQSPPLALELMLDTARTERTAPLFITLYSTHPENPDATPDLAKWSTILGLEVREGGVWSWTSSTPGAGPALVHQKPLGQLFAGFLPRLQPALLILGFTLSLHLVALLVDQARLDAEQDVLRAGMEAEFRRVFPDAVTVVDPVLQMRRQLGTARQQAGLADSSDFLPLLENVALATRELSAGELRTLVWKNGRMTLGFSSAEESTVSAIKERMQQSGLQAETAPPIAGSTDLVMNIQSL